MPEITIAKPSNSVPGVMVTPPSMIRDSIKKQVDLALAEVPEGKTGALVAVATLKGVNLVVAYKDPIKGWEAAAFLGKSWNGDTEAGAQVKKTW